MKVFRVAAFVLLGAMSSSAHAQYAKEAKWFQGSSEHFVLFTDTSEAKARRLLTDLESRVAGFAVAIGSMRPRQFPIEVFLYRNREDFMAVIPKLAPVNGYVPIEDDAYLFTGPDRLFLVAKDVTPDSIANDAGHALGHVLLDHEVMWRPFWLSEGVGEYVRKLGRGADTKGVAQKDAYPVDDLFTIVASADYQDNEPDVAFRTQSYRLFRLLLDEKPQALREWIGALDREDGDRARLNIDMEEITEKFASYKETPVKMTPSDAAVKTEPADPATLSIHRGDLMLAVNQPGQAGRFYNGDWEEARAARAILTRYSRLPAEALQQLERASQDLPGSGLMQYHFGAMDAQNKKDLDAQAAALERAVKLLPLLGRADGELARVYARTGKVEQSLPLLTHALDLEPEFADRFYAIRAEVLVAMNRYDDALTAMKIAVDLPHGDRKSTEAYLAKAATLTRNIENARREVESKRVDQIRRGVEAKVSVLEPPPPPPKPEVVVRSGQINFQIAARSVVDVVDTVYPEYPEAMRQAGKTGRIALRVDIASDGKVKDAVVTTSQLPELNAATVDAVKKWTFKLPPRGVATSIALTLTFALQ